MQHQVKIAHKIHEVVEKLMIEEAKFNEGNQSAGTRARKHLHPRAQTPARNQGAVRRWPEADTGHEEHSGIECLCAKAR